MCVTCTVEEKLLIVTCCRTTSVLNGIDLCEHEGLKQEVVRLAPSGGHRDIRRGGITVVLHRLEVYKSALL